MLVGYLKVGKSLIPMRTSKCHLLASPASHLEAIVASCLECKSNTPAGPVLAFHPKVFSVKPEVSKTDKVIIPPLDGDEGDGYLHDADYEEQLLDWLGMVILNSPRILDYDEVDPYLSLWRPPNAADASKSSETKSVTTDTLVTMQWQGLASASFIRHLLLAIRKVIGHSWFAISASAFNGHSYMLLLNGSRKALMWEIPADM